MRLFWIFQKIQQANFFYIYDLYKASDVITYIRKRKKSVEGLSRNWLKMNIVLFSLYLQLNQFIFILLFLYKHIVNKIQ